MPVNRGTIVLSFFRMAAMVPHSGAMLYGIHVFGDILWGLLGIINKMFEYVNN